MKYYIADAFTDEVFKGNPAGVCILDKELSADEMQHIATENNLSETAFAYKTGEHYKLRWFTPGFEINLCGHATLATAHIICTYVEPGKEHVDFETCSGILSVQKNGDFYEMSFPKLPPKQIPATHEIVDALGFSPVEVYSERDLYIVMENEDAIRSYQADYATLRTLKDWLGVVITAKGTDADFVSRYFCPELDLEDPVTGSSHSSLIPLWSEKLKKQKLLAKQLSPRGGTLLCENGAEQVKISGQAVLYLQGEIL